MYFLNANFSKNFLYAGRVFQGEHGVTAMIYPPNISVFVDKNSRQIVKDFVIVLFNTQVKALNNNSHIFTFRTGMLASLLQHNKSLKIIAVEKNMITVPLI